MSASADVLCTGRVEYMSTLLRDGRGAPRSSLHFPIRIFAASAERGRLLTLRRFQDDTAVIIDCGGTCPILGMEGGAEGYGGTSGAEWRRRTLVQEGYVDPGQRLFVSA
jgi:hypothetical protein